LSVDAARCLLRRRRRRHGAVVRASPAGSARQPTNPGILLNRFSLTSRLLVSSAALGLAHCLSAQSTAAPTPVPPTEEAVRLPEFTVSGQKADAYRAADTMSLARIRGALIDTPVTVNVLTRELFDDLGANSTFEAARYFPGIANGRGAGTNGGINDRMNFRGFESQTRTVNNFSSTFIPGTSTSIDTIEPEYIERVEIVMGPNAILNPTGTPGGSMNVVTKSPLFKQQAVLKAVVGNYSAQKFSFDVTGPVALGGLGGKLAYRLIGTAQDTDTYIPGSFEKWTGGLMLEYQFTPQSKLEFKYIGVDYKAYENASAPNDNGWLIYEPTSIRSAILPDEPLTPGVTYNGRNGVNVNSITVERTNTLQLQYTGSLFKTFSMRLAGQLLSHNNVGDSAFPNLATNSSTFDPVTGEVTAVPAYNPAAVPVVWRYNKGIGVMHSFQNDYAANWKFGDAASLQFVTGWTYNHNHNFPSRTGTAPMPNVNMFTGDGLTAPRPDLKTAFSFGNRSEAEATQKQAYALFKAGFLADRAFVTGGATRTWVKSQQYARNPLTAALASYTALSGAKDSYIGSLLVKPVKTVSAYYTYSTNANLVTFNPGNGISVPLWSEGKQHEVGVKSELLNQRLSLVATWFKMEQTNVTSPNPLANTNPQLAGNILTDNTSKGYELSAVGGLTKNISVIASYTRQKYRDFAGRRQRNVPDDVGGGLLRYTFTEGALKNLSVFGAVSYFGEAPGETITALAPAAAAGAARVPALPGFYTAAWNVWNAGASYNYGAWSFNLNVDNLTNKKFGWQPASRLTVSPYPELTWRLTTAVKF
jgi:iron complex outermembrane receptor protein